MNASPRRRYVTETIVIHSIGRNDTVEDQLTHWLNLPDYEGYRLISVCPNPWRADGVFFAVWEEPLATVEAEL